MNVKELCNLLTAQADPEAEVLIYDPDGEDLFPVTAWTMNPVHHDPKGNRIKVITLEADDDYLPDDSPWKVGEH